jgi:acid phosphatase type 7
LKIKIYFKVLIGFSVIICLGILLWILSLHGSLAMVKIDNLIRLAFILVGAFAFSLALLSLWRYRLIRYRHFSFGKVLLAPILILIIICLIIPGIAFVYINDLFQSANPVPPVLLKMTESSNSSRLRFAVSGDAHFGAGTNRPEITASIVRQIAEPTHSYAIFFSVGDLVDMGTRKDGWQSSLDELKPLTSSIPVAFVPGNHDNLFKGIDLYKYYTSLQPYSSPVGNTLFYRIDKGNIHFLILDLEWGVEEFSEEQSEWLETQLRDIPRSDWKIVLSHAYYYSSGSLYHGYSWSDNPKLIEAFVPLFEKYGVDLVISGHNHHMEYLQRSDVTYTICGAFGGLTDPERQFVSSSSIWYAHGQYGFMDVTIENYQAALVFRDPQNKEISSFSLKNKRM